MTPQGLLVGIAAGLASALLVAGLATQTAMAIVLSIAAPMPILIASLGWGSIPGFVAAATSALLIGFMSQTPETGLVLLASMALPAAVVGHLCGLARPREERTGRPIAPANDGGQVPLDWYPLERILFAIALLSAAGCVVLFSLGGADLESMAPSLVEAIVASGGSDLDATPEQLEEIARLVVGTFPFVQAAVLSLNLIGTLYLAAMVTRMSGRLQRPRDDVPSQTSLPRIALPVFAVALGASFLEGIPGLVGAASVGALGFAFVLVGLAAFHNRSRGRAARGLLLVTVYFALLVLYFPIFVLLFYGILLTARSGGPTGGTR